LQRRAFATVAFASHRTKIQTKHRTYTAKPHRRIYSNVFGYVTILTATHLEIGQGVYI